MTKTLMSLCVLAAVFAQGMAITCYTFGGFITVSSGRLTCSGGATPVCYSYMSGSSNVSGCNTNAGYCSSNSLYPYCIECTTDLCNTQSPSNISCYYRTAYTTTLGTQNDCFTGMTSCYSYNSTGEGGCGTCANSASSTGCTSCTTSLCNTNTYTATTTTTTAPGRSSASVIGVSAVAISATAACVMLLQALVASI